MMRILIQLILFCALFTALVKYAVRGGAVDGLFFYPKAVQEKAFDYPIRKRWRKNESVSCRYL